MTQTFLCDIDPHSKAVNHISHDKLCKKSQLSFSFSYGCKCVIVTQFNHIFWHTKEISIWMCTVATIHVMRFVYLSYGCSVRIALLDDAVSCVRSEVGSLVIWVCTFSQDSEKPAVCFSLTFILASVCLTLHIDPTFQKPSSRWRPLVESATLLRARQGHTNRWLLREGWVSTCNTHSTMPKQTTDKILGRSTSKH